MSTFTAESRRQATTKPPPRGRQAAAKPPPRIKENKARGHGGDTNKQGPTHVGNKQIRQPRSVLARGMIEQATSEVKCNLGRAVWHCVRLLGSCKITKTTPFRSVPFRSPPKFASN
jgi:hypothetical protein